MHYQNLYLIGSSHIAKQSIWEVTQAIERLNPGIVALELDKQRLHLLLSDKEEQGRRLSLKMIQKVGFKGFLFSLFGAWAEKKLGDTVGVKPGAEMKAAAQIAQQRGIPIALIDRNIETTLHRLSKSITWKEKWRIVVDVFKAVILRKNEYTFDLNTVPDQKLIEKMIADVKVRYPSFYRVLITERNRVMAARLQYVMEHNPQKEILAIVGAGHEEDIIELLKKHAVSSQNM